ncbi:hypothetical protein BHU72_01070 [Desulfuribacillus stibiiarsenatis]|uniref:4Fe-4S ferredoxin-type domain-containing protein n=1 Tax=Desulfuribacillus stibiiarsenatis TaxID=1390249 RepID=A0A1E5LA17_9FIRM|nr:4Fe-4S dicluster domain-containing protein [Desulfuribacillus stibiiarsenatis]OEH86884.1 hypothetical protein BHU72_01070 [Desulfuribacillus stibiiarsenatis]
MNKQKGFLINLDKCIGCKGCEMACQNEHRLLEKRRRKITGFDDRQRDVSGFISMACNHCESPACIAVCPKHCFKKRRNGIVFHDALHCSGCKSCVGACPFGAPKYITITGKVDKCNMCAERLEHGLQPACTSSCITGALSLINLSANENMYCRLPANIKMAQFTKPSVRFILPNKPKQYWLKADKSGEEGLT